MAKKKKVEAPKASEPIDEQCPVTGAACESSCEPDDCKATVRDHVAIDADEASEPFEVVEEHKSSSKKSDLENHPKFAKFKKAGGQPK